LIEGGTRALATAPDGSRVEVYALLPPLGEAEIAHGVLTPGAEVLEPGCGTGRVAHLLNKSGRCTPRCGTCTATVT
jgi:hypothetical protein